MVEERPDPRARGGELFDEAETGLSQGECVGEMVLGVERWGEPVAELSKHPCRSKNEAVQGNGSLGGEGPLAWGPPVDKFRLGD